MGTGIPVFKHSLEARVMCQYQAGHALHTGDTDMCHILHSGTKYVHCIGGNK